MGIFDDSDFTWGQAGLPGTGLTAGEKTTINSRLTNLEATPIPVSIGDLADVELLGAANGEFLGYTNGVWYSLDVPVKTIVSSLNFVVNDGGGVIAPGVKGYCDLVVPFACTVTKWIVYNDQAGSIVLDVWRDTYANYPPTVADKITGTLKPQTTNSIKGFSSSVSSWSALNAEDVLRINVDSAATVTRSTLSLIVTRTV